MRTLSLLTLGSILLLSSLVSSTPIVRNRETLSPLPENVVKARALAAIVGGFVADAAAIPLHWIYDVNEIAKLVGYVS